jgi:hypothetical protein
VTTLPAIVRSSSRKMEWIRTQRDTGEVQESEAVISDKFR